jgi:plasmid stabilization system protein ParE
LIVGLLILREALWRRWFASAEEDGEFPYAGRNSVEDWILGDIVSFLYRLS